jgi:hypothetical protein
VFPRAEGLSDEVMQFPVRVRHRSGHGHCRRTCLAAGPAVSGV